MKVELKNLGVLKAAEFELGNLTIICGKNNTGKTYATYALYGFLKLWRHFIEFTSLKDNYKDIIDRGVTYIDLNEQMNSINDLLKRGCKDYTEVLYKVLASQESLFSESEILITVDISGLDVESEYRREMTRKGRTSIIFSKVKNSPELEVTWFIENGEPPISFDAFESVTNEVLQDIIIAPLLPNVFISSTERTGAALFRKELDFARNRLVEELGRSKEKDLDPFGLLDRVFQAYALPVNDNVDFTRSLDSVDKQESYLVNEYPDILKEFRIIVGGDYKVTGDKLFFVTRKGKTRLTLEECSSSVRSLMDLAFFLKNIAKKGDLLIIDEPELNLHPENQRKIAQLFAKLVNAGISVFITTHSDYIIKELNTLIMLNTSKEQCTEIIEKHKYSENMLLSTEKVKVYLAEERGRNRITTLVPAEIDTEYGIEVGSFDDSINEMNRIQEAILFAEE
ncbi:MAG: AAA family ATPase [Candidatus Hatepunaea meridiana]|nr:AAA family ATPase [Candidatus Hatepunaea meridiana]